MLTIAVCDDNPQFAHLLTKKIRELCAYHLPDRIDCHIAPAFGSGEDVLKYLQNHIINVMFLDIDMPYYSGMDIASYISENNLSTILIFVTSHDELVFKTFAYKPFGFLRKTHLTEEIDELIDRLSKELEFRKQELVIAKAGEIVKIPLNEISYIESDGNYLNIRTSEEIIRHRETMTNMENELKGKDFIRCHKGYLVNVNHIEKMKMSELVVKCGNDDAILPVGRSYEKDVKKKIMEGIKRG